MTFHKDIFAYIFSAQSKIALSVFKSVVVPQVRMAMRSA